MKGQCKSKKTETEEEKREKKAENISREGTFRERWMY